MVFRWVRPVALSLVSVFAFSFMQTPYAFSLPTEEPSELSEPSSMLGEVSDEKIAEEIIKTRDELDNIVDDIVRKESELFEKNQQLEEEKVQLENLTNQLRGAQKTINAEEMKVVQLRNSQKEQLGQLSSAIRSAYMNNDVVMSSELGFLTDAITENQITTPTLSPLTQDVALDNIFRKKIDDHVKTEESITEKSEQIAQVEKTKNRLTASIEEQTEAMKVSSAEVETLNAELLNMESRKVIQIEKLRQYEGEAVARQTEKDINLKILQNYLKSIPDLARTGNSEAFLLTVRAGKGLWAWPLKDYISVNSEAGPRNHPATGVLACHAGVDVAAPSGTPLLAPYDGVVVKKEISGSGYGNHVVIQHDSAVSTLLAHMQDVSVRLGERVKRGQLVGTVGSTGDSTGPHLHFEVRVNSVPYEPAHWYLGVKKPVQC